MGIVSNHSQYLKYKGYGGEEIGPEELQDGEPMQFLQIQNPEAKVHCVGEDIIFYTSCDRGILVKILPTKRRACITGKALLQSHEVSGLRCYNSLLPKHCCPATIH